MDTNSTLNVLLPLSVMRLRHSNRAALGGALSLACLAGQAAGLCVRPTIAGYDLSAVVETDLRRTNSVPERCDAAAVTVPPTDCSATAGYVEGTGAAPSTTCPTTVCILTPASNFDVTGVACAAGYGDGSGGAATPTVSQCTASGQAYQLSGCLRQPECLSIAGADPVGYDVSGVAENDRLLASFDVTGVTCATGYRADFVAVESCVAPAGSGTDCVTGYTAGSAAAPSTTCPGGCTFTPATNPNIRAVVCAGDDQAYTFAGCTPNVCQTPQSAVPWDEPTGYEGRATCTSTTTGSISCTFDDTRCSTGYNGRFGIDPSSGIDYTNREITCDAHGGPLTFGGCHVDCPTGTSTAAGALALPSNGVYNGCGTAAGGTDVAMAAHEASCSLGCAAGYTLNPAGAQAVCTDGQIAHSATCDPDDCELTKPSFGDWVRNFD